MTFLMLWQYIQSSINGGDLCTSPSPLTLGASTNKNKQNKCVIQSNISILFQQFIVTIQVQSPKSKVKRTWSDSILLFQNSIQDCYKVESNSSFVLFNYSNLKHQRHFSDLRRDFCQSWQAHLFFKPSLLWFQQLQQPVSSLVIPATNRTDFIIGRTRRNREMKHQQRFKRQSLNSISDIDAS